MLTIESAYAWLLHSALVSLGVLLVGSVAVLLCRQPGRRLQIIGLTLAGCLIAPWLGMISGYPRLPIGWLATQESATGCASGYLPDNTKAVTGSASAALPPNPLVDDLPSTVSGEASGTHVGTQAVVPVALDDEVAPPTRFWNLASWVVTLYVFGVAIGIAWWLAGMVVLLRILRTSQPAPPRCRQLLAEIAGRRSARVRVLVNHRVKQPFASTWWPTAIVLPEDMCNDGGTVPIFVAGRAPTEGWSRQRGRHKNGTVPLPGEQALRWALAHEWTHVERHDVRAWFAAGLVRLLFFYQPLIWWLRRQLRLCQDYVADAQASRQGPQTEDYAEFLTARAVAGSWRPVMIGLGMGARKSELFRRVVMLVEKPPLESRAPRLWTASATCLALVLSATAASLSLGPQPATGSANAATDPAPSANGSARAASASAAKPFAAKLPGGVTVELLGISAHPSNEHSWWRPDGSPLPSAACDPLNGSVSGRPNDVVREVAIQLHNPSSRPATTQILFFPPYDWGSDVRPRRLGKHVAGLEGMIVSLPDVPAVTVRVGLAAGPWQTVCEAASGSGSIGTQIGGFAFSPVFEKDGSATITVTHDIADRDSRVVAVALDGRELAPNSWSGAGASNFHQITATFSGLRPEAIKAFRVQTRPYEWVEFRDVSIRPGEKTDVQIVPQPATGSGSTARPQNTPPAGSSASSTGGASGTQAPQSTVERRTINKMVKDFPEKADLSTPESAVAALHRSTARGDVQAECDLSWVKPAVPAKEFEREVKNARNSAAKFSQRRRNILAKFSQYVLDTELVEVLTYHRDLATVVIKCSLHPANRPYAAQHFGRIDGKWKNLDWGATGADFFPTVAATEESFEKKKGDLWRSFVKVREDIRHGRTPIAAWPKTPRIPQPSLSDVEKADLERWKSQTWRIHPELDMPSGELQAVQFAIFDKDPVPGFTAQVKKSQKFNRQQLNKAGNEADRERLRPIQMAANWDRGFKSVTGDQLYMLANSLDSVPSVSSNSPAGKRWVATKTVRIDGKPTCWCIPVEVKTGEDIGVTFDKSNTFDLRSVYDKAMAEPVTGGGQGHPATGRASGAPSGRTSRSPASTSNPARRPGTSRS